MIYNILNYFLNTKHCVQLRYAITYVGYIIEISIIFILLLMNQANLIIYLIFMIHYMLFTAIIHKLNPNNWLILSEENIKKYATKIKFLKNIEVEI